MSITTCILWCILSFAIGEAVGILIMCLCFVAKEADKHIEESGDNNAD